MKRPRTVLPKPRYTERRWLKSERAWGYFFCVPAWARHPSADDPRPPCPLKNEALGIDYAAAVDRVERILLPQFDTWRTQGAFELAKKGPTHGSFDWMVSVYRCTPQYQKLSKRQKRNFEYGLEIASNHKLKDNPYGLEHFGQLQLQSITPGAADNLYASAIKGRAKIGNEESLDTNSAPRLRRAAEMVKACRRAWRVAHRQHPDIVPFANPFEKMEVKTDTKETTPATWEQIQAFVATCDAAGEWSIGTAALVAFCWLQRQEHILGVPREDGCVTGLLWVDYRPKDFRDFVLIQHPKTNDAVLAPLYAKDGRALFPELMRRLDNAPRRGALICLRDRPSSGGVFRPWATPTANNPLSDFIHRVAELRDIAGLPKAITFRSFRHGGFTAGRDVDLSDADLNAIGAKTEATLDTYAKTTIEQRRRAFTRLLEFRSKAEQMSK